MNDIPPAARAAVDERDGYRCRGCGRWLGEGRYIHHIFYGGDAVGMGGRRKHVLDNLVTVCMACHERFHSNKGKYQPFVAEVVKNPGTTVNQLMRWYQGWDKRSFDR